MRIAILIPSRNRPRLLSAAITALHEMESGENEIEYRVGYDWDDPKTKEVCDSLPNTKGTLIPMSMLTIGEIWNFLSDTFRATADIYSCMIDDAFCISPHWDKEMVRVAKDYQAFSWYEVSAPWNIGYPTCTKEWLKSCGYIVPEYFPFWFMDTWFGEMAQFVTNNPVPMSQAMALFSKQEETQNLRELSWWWGFFNATRGIRLKEANEMLSSPLPFEEFKVSRKLFIDVGNARDHEFRGVRIEKLEAARGVKSEPSARYLLAKDRADKYLQANGLEIWK